MDRAHPTRPLSDLSRPTTDADAPPRSDRSRNQRVRSRDRWYEKGIDALVRLHTFLSRPRDTVWVGRCPATKLRRRELSVPLSDSKASFRRTRQCTFMQLLQAFSPRLRSIPAHRAGGGEAQLDRDDHLATAQRRYQPPTTRGASKPGPARLDRDLRVSRRDPWRNFGLLRGSVRNSKNLTARECCRVR